MDTRLKTYLRFCYGQRAGAIASNTPLNVYKAFPANGIRDHLNKLDDIALQQLHQHYKDRFGIETSYRMKNQCRIRTSSKNPVTRLLFVALAFILVNFWVYLLWFFVYRTRPGGRMVYRGRFGLKTMLEFLSHAVEQRFPVKSLQRSISPPQHEFAIY